MGSQFGRRDRHSRYSRLGIEQSLYKRAVHTGNNNTRNSRDAKKPIFQRCFEKFLFLVCGNFQLKPRTTGKVKTVEEVSTTGTSTGKHQQLH
jgi:hypothetical protein